MRTFWNCSPSFWDTQIERDINPPVSKNKKDRPRSARVWLDGRIHSAVSASVGLYAHHQLSVPICWPFFGIAQTWNKYTTLNCYSGLKFNRKIYIGYQDSYAWPVVLVIMNHFNPFSKPNPSLGLINIWCSKLVWTDVWKGVERISWQLPDLSSKQRNRSTDLNCRQIFLPLPWTLPEQIKIPYDFGLGLTLNTNSMFLTLKLCTLFPK